MIHACYIYFPVYVHVGRVAVRKETNSKRQFELKNWDCRCIGFIKDNFRSLIYFIAAYTVTHILMITL